MTKGTFTLRNVITAIYNNSGNEEAALLELQKDQLKPFLMRICGPPTGVDNEEAAPLRGHIWFSLSLNYHFIHFKYTFINIEFLYSCEKENF
jgi:hypothetical protein